MTEMKKYSVQVYRAQTNGLPYDLADVEFDGQSYAVDEFDTLEEARAALAGEYPEFVESNFDELVEIVKEMQENENE